VVRAIERPAAATSGKSSAKKLIELGSAGRDCESARQANEAEIDVGHLVSYWAIYIGLEAH